MAPSKLKHIENAKLIKHQPPRRQTEKELFTRINIKSATPFISAVKRVLKRIEQLPKKQPKAKYISVVGMGACIEKTLNIGLHFQHKLDKKVEIHTHTVKVLDEFSIKVDDGDDDDEQILRKRNVSGVEVRIYV